MASEKAREIVRSLGSLGGDDEDAEIIDAAVKPLLEALSLRIPGTCYSEFEEEKRREHIALLAAWGRK